jgi:threonine dehydrogenase-like Zn-dependent dehydrogenase
MEFVELPDPAVGPGQVLIRMKEIAVCGSDLVKYLATQPVSFPTPVGVPAHECVGIVVESTLDGYKPGDRVLFFPPHQDGLHEYVVATSPIQVLKLPADGDLSHWMMAQLLGTIIHATRELGAVMSDRIAVIGQGPVGQLFNHLLWNLGAHTIIGIDKIPERLAVSPKMHATHTLQVGKDDVLGEVRRLTNGRGLDTVVEASGYDETLEMMVRLVRRDGRVLMFGQPKHLDVKFPIMEMYNKRLHVVTTTGPDVELDIAMALRYIQDGRMDVTPILTHRFPLDRVREAYELFAERKDGCVKVVVQFPGSDRR